MKHSKKKKGSMYPGGGHFKKKPNANMPKQQMRMGGKLKPVNKEDNPGLAKLPTDVRNKMGFMAMGGMMKADEDFMYGGKMMKKMMYGGKMKKAGHGMKMKKGSMYPGGGRMQHD
tara:strand:- start:128 stop:472 length:345 start_codon:yes stop_codon:yes gene_type:complete